MSLHGLPDFHQPIQVGGLQIFYPYEGGRDHILVPDQLEVAEHNDGRPDFLLELVRGQNPLLPPAPYGVLDFRVRPRYPMEEALKLLRDRHPGAMIAPAVFSSGFLRLRPVIDADDMPADLRIPVPLAWNGLGTTRFILKLLPPAITLLKRLLLEAELLALHAAAELEMIGVSPRLPIRLRFNPAELLDTLIALGNEKRQIAREDIVNFFRTDPRSLPLEVHGKIEGLELDGFAEAVTDRIRVRFGAFVPAPEKDVKPYLSLVSPEEIGSGSFEWDLSEPIQAPRPLVLHLDPIAAARALVRDHGLEAIVRETVVPPIQTGVLSIWVAANLPAHRPGLLSLGVTIHAPPCPPHRVHTIVESAELHPPEDATMIHLRLSPAEKLEYTFSTFVVLRDATGIERLEGRETPHQGSRLDLSLDDFPVSFVSIGASQGLLELAAVHGICRRLKGESEVEQPFELAVNQPTIALALPKGKAGATLEIEARSREGAKALQLGPFPARNLQLGLHSFPEYGSHRVEITCVFDNDLQLFAIDLLPEDRPETAEGITVLHFTPAQLKREWTWWARSPFRAGYRYRTHRSPDESPAEWSEIRSPFESLNIRAEGRVPRPSG